MRTRDIANTLNMLRMDRCKNDLTDLRIILNIMSQQTSFDYRMAVKHAELFFKQGKYEELGLLLMTIGQEIPGYDDDLVKNAQFLLNKINDELQLAATAKQENVAHVYPRNDNQGSQGASL